MLRQVRTSHILHLHSLDGSIRDKAFKTLRRWLEGKCEELEASEYLKLWKALFYCMWMADKPSYQQNLATRLGDIWLDMHRRSPAGGLLYARAFWETICREWSGIDRHRLDKYYFLVRRFYVAGLETIFLSKADRVQQGEGVGKMLLEWPLNPKRSDVPDALRIYLLENFTAVFRTASLKTTDPLSEKDACTILCPFIDLAAQSEKKSVLSAFEGLYKELPEEFSGSLDLTTIGNLCLSRGEVENVSVKNRQVLYAASRLFQNHQTPDPRP